MTIYLANALMTKQYPEFHGEALLLIPILIGVAVIISLLDSPRNPDR